MTVERTRRPCATKGCKRFAARKYCSPCGKVMARGSKAKLVKTCATCRKTFTTWTANKVYCDRACQRDGTKDRSHKKQDTFTWHRDCATCGTRFRTVRIYQRYCSVSCRNVQGLVVQGDRNGMFFPPQREVYPRFAEAR